MKPILQLLLVLLSISSLLAQEECEKTGPTCYNLEDCATLAAGRYQWCGNCTHVVACSDTQPDALESSLFPDLYPVWDDNKKGFYATSATCYDCYYDCPPGPSAPKTDPCVKTGPTCAPAELVYCNGVVDSTKFQICEDCTRYLDCRRAIDGQSTIGSCPDGTSWDNSVKNCTSESTTCFECYSLCDAPEATTSTSGAFYVDSNIIITSISLISVIVTNKIC